MNKAIIDYQLKDLKKSLSNEILDDKNDNKNKNFNSTQ